MILEPLEAWPLGVGRVLVHSNRSIFSPTQTPSIDG